LKKGQSHHDAAAEKSHDNGPHHYDHVASLHPRRLAPEKKFSQHAKRRIVWFDIYHYEAKPSNVHHNTELFRRSRKTPASIFAQRKTMGGPEKVLANPWSRQKITKRVRAGRGKNK
jgi:hypothetical protein